MWRYTAASLRHAIHRIPRDCPRSLYLARKSAGQLDHISMYSNISTLNWWLFSTNPPMGLCCALGRAAMLIYLLCFCLTAGDVKLDLLLHGSSTPDAQCYAASALQPPTIYENTRKFRRGWRMTWWDCHQVLQDSVFPLNSVSCSLMAIFSVLLPRKLRSSRTLFLDTYT